MSFKPLTPFILSKSHPNVNRTEETSVKADLRSEECIYPRLLYISIKPHQNHFFLLSVHLYPLSKYAVHSFI
jgi:hypothetical protein